MPEDEALFESRKIFFFSRSLCKDQAFQNASCSWRCLRRSPVLGKELGGRRRSQPVRREWGRGNAPWISARAFGIYNGTERRPRVRPFPDLSQTSMSPAARSRHRGALSPGGWRLLGQNRDGKANPPCRAAFTCTRTPSQPRGLIDAAARLLPETGHQ